MNDQFFDYKPIYTDGSKDCLTVASATVTPSTTYTSRLHDGSSIFTAEAKAILKAIHHIKNSDPNKYIIFTDSLSCLQAIKNCKCDYPIIRDILTMHNTCLQCDIVFCWLPSHMGIRGNIKADSAAKSALNSKYISSTKVPYTDSKPAIKSYIKHCWRSRWDQQQYNKLHYIQPHLGYKSLFSLLPGRKHVSCVDVALDTRILHILSF